MTNEQVEQEIVDACDRAITAGLMITPDVCGVFIAPDGRYLAYGRYVNPIGAYLIGREARHGIESPWTRAGELLGIGGEQVGHFGRGFSESIDDPNDKRSAIIKKEEEKPFEVVGRRLAQRYLR